MGINFAETKVSMDFPYQDDVGRIYNVKYFYNEENKCYFISINDSLGQSAVFPVTPLIEVVDFLKSRGLVGSAETIATNLSSKKVNNTGGMVLPLPVKTKTASVNAQEEPTQAVQSFIKPKKTTITKKEGEPVVEASSENIKPLKAIEGKIADDTVKDEDIIAERKAKGAGVRSHPLPMKASESSRIARK